MMPPKTNTAFAFIDTFPLRRAILKSTTEVTWAGRESKSPSQRAPVGDTVKRGGGGKVIQNKRRTKNDVESRVHWTLNTEQQFIIIDHLYQSADSMIS